MLTVMLTCGFLQMGDPQSPPEVLICFNMVIHDLDDSWYPHDLGHLQITIKHVIS